MQFQYSFRDRKYVICGSESVYRERITDVLLAEHALLELSQREEMLHHRATALDKTLAVESDRLQPEKTNSVESTRTELEKTHQQLKEAQVECARKEYALYEATSMLTPYIKKLYDNLRRDPKWFMREELVQDCSDRGGCCSRECGCCAQRCEEEKNLLQRKKGRGHCTTECQCCIGFRGFEFPEEDKEKIRRDFEAKVKYPITGSAYFIKLANWYFCPLKCQKPSNPSKPKSRRYRIFGRGSTDEKES
ncbi:hypothetical protein N7534_003110 [Penicillium rubens]|nr:hypothetical protein N7534_003110 [Penicillium rubens]